MFHFKCLKIGVYSENMCKNQCETLFKSKKKERLVYVCLIAQVDCISCTGGLCFSGGEIARKGRSNIKNFPREEDAMPLILLVPQNRIISEKQSKLYKVPYPLLLKSQSPDRDQKCDSISNKLPFFVQLLSNKILCALEFSKLPLVSVLTRDHAVNMVTEYMIYGSNPKLY